MTIRLRLLTGFLILILIFIAYFFINQRLSSEVIRNMNYLSNSETVIRNSNLLNKDMTDMQSGFRGYLLTGQESFLQPYYQARNTIPSLIKAQKELITSGIQKHRLNTIIRLHQDWVKYANSLITTKNDTFPDASRKYQELFESKVKMEVGKKLNDKIREIFIAFDAREYELRHERRTELQKSIKRTRYTALALTIFSLVIALLSGSYIIHIITSRISKMVKLAGEISKGNFKTIEDDKSDELKKLSESLNIMSGILDKNFKELIKKNNELDQFAYVVSHDLKAPLRGIENIITWMEEDHAREITPGLKKNLDMIKGRSQRLENMINGLLAYAKIGRVQKKLEKTDVKLMLEELLELLVPPLYEVEIDGKMPIIETEKIRLEQVFSNLISNAVKHNTSQNGKIAISCTDMGDYFKFSVADNGPGIEKDYIEKIFLIFQTLKERDAFESTGLGLAIVKKIIDEEKTTIHVESELGVGTKFIFTWPKNINKK